MFFFSDTFSVAFKKHDQSHLEQPAAICFLGIFGHVLLFSEHQIESCVRSPKNNSLLQKGVSIVLWELDSHSNKGKRNPFMFVLLLAGTTIYHRIRARPCGSRRRTRGDRGGPPGLREWFGPLRVGLPFRFSTCNWTKGSGPQAGKSSRHGLRRDSTR